MYGIVLATMCTGFLRCAEKRGVVICLPPEEVLPPPNPYPMKATISGVVKNEDGQQLPNATVKINETQTVQTDGEGKFSMETVLNNAGSTAALYISYSGLVTAVRSYHANMQNAVYDVTLHPPITCCIKNECFISPVNTIEYSNYSTNINEELENILMPLVDSLKQHPFCSLRFTAYGKGNKPGSRADERLRQIGEFFSGKGISESRIISIKQETKMTEFIDVEVLRIRD